MFAVNESSIYNNDSHNFIGNNKINLSLDVAIETLALPGGEGEELYPFYFRPTIGMIEPWFDKHGQTTEIYRQDRYGHFKSYQWLFNHFPSLNLKIIELEVVINVNNKKGCLFDNLVKSNNNYIINIKDKTISFGHWAKLAIPNGCFTTTEVNKMSTVITIPSLEDNGLVAKTSYLETIVNLHNKVEAAQEQLKISPFLKYQLYNIATGEFYQKSTLAENNFEISFNHMTNNFIDQLFKIRTELVFDKEQFKGFPIDVWSKIDKINNFYNYNFNPLLTETTIIESKTKYDSDKIRGYLQYDFGTKSYYHHFIDKPYFDSKKEVVSFQPNFDNRMMGFITNPFLAQEQVFLSTKILQWNITINQILVSQPNYNNLRIKILEQELDPHNELTKLIDSFNQIYLINNFDLRNYFNQEFTKEVFDTFSAEFYYKN
ncbi:hypothetical protein SSYRP_v1c09130 [Spiroplasma syrphidicola EA-1]|uniref:Uncharacterized protein n=1 Tax=Spiroplasma syrphidicola EA-1 TaxID=1276229 RepID=R4U4U5_9MOLU|nr:hypothetical protein [Spiroplasma syrphidicola]AGM26502.1 hypothetical protein SSYRP_v1c09130 [Spiroplasma syrphidicola EA-1]